VTEPIQVYIGTEPNQWLATEVLRCSIERRTKTPFFFKELKPISLDLHANMFTGFSFFRWCIPDLCHYKGRALYLDADMVVLCDIEELFHLPNEGKPVLARKKEEKESFHTSVMPMDCARLTHWKPQEWVRQVNQDPNLYLKIMQAAEGAPNHVDMAPLPDRYNDLEHYQPDSKIIHYTNVATQPWKKEGHPLAEVFLRELRLSIEDDEIPLEIIQREIAAGHVRASLLEELK